MAITPAGSSWLDVTGVGVSKATTLEKLRTVLEIPREANVAIADGANDIEALTWAARGIAMGHASAAVRLAADEVTGTIDEDGAAAVLTSLLPGSWPTQSRDHAPRTASSSNAARIGQRQTDGHRIVTTTESASACQE